jgi:hypothetical protein
MPSKDTQFKPGQSGNRDGRPKRTRELAAKISEMDEVYRQRLHTIALEGEHKDSTAAIKLLWAYAHGNPTQPVSDPNLKPLGSGSASEVLLTALQAFSKRV